MIRSDFVSKIKNIRLERAFNPYADRCAKYDPEHAPEIRASLLSNLIEAAEKAEVEAIWVGRDLGYRGGRRTGLALTDDMHFHEHLSRWKLSLDRPTKGNPIAERTAGVIWTELEQISAPIFLWNVFPFHPFREGNEFSNRPHTKVERRIGMELLLDLIKLIKPKHLVAVGNDAESALHELNLRQPVIKVRHPSYGGQSVFSRQIRDLYELTPLDLFSGASENAVSAL